MEKKRVCVIGAGVIGLTTAFRIQSELPDVEVMLISERFSPETTSDVAAGIWGALFLGDRNDSEKITQWSGETHTFLHQLWLSEDCNRAGVAMLPCYYISKEKTGLPDWKDIVLGFREMSSEELPKFGSGIRQGFQFTTFTCESIKFLPFLMELFLSKGGKVEKRRIDKMEDLMMDTNFSDVAVLCPGLQAFDLLGDTTCYPIRGQIMRVKAPWIRHCILDVSDDGNYIIPNENWVVLGGTHQEGNWSTNSEEQDSSFIWKGCCELEPSLKEATHMENIVGLRPGRPKIRLEKETMTFPSGRSLQVVHNYGHAGGGITLSWGCAGEATKLVQQCLQQLSSNK